MTVDANPGMTTMVKSSNQRYRTLSTALTIIDPKGLLLPGTKEHNRVTEKILSWMDEMEPDEVLRKSEDARRIFQLKRSLGNDTATENRRRDFRKSSAANRSRQHSAAGNSPIR